MKNCSSNEISNQRKLTHIDLEVTRQCNLHCIHCSASEQNRGDEMPMSQIENFLIDSKQLGLEKIGLTGGEPFLNRTRLMEISNFITKKLCVPIHIHSNGTLISESDAKWMKRNNVQITVSFYGGNSEIHDSITRVKGSFLATLNGCQNLINENADLCAYFVPMKMNFQTIRELIQVLFDMGIKKLRILTLSPTGRAQLHFGNLELHEMNFKTLMNDLKNIKNDIKIDVSTGFCTSQNLKDLNILEGHEECFAGENRVHIDPSGNVFPCTASSGNMQFLAGTLNLPNSGLSSIWRDSKILKIFRDFHMNPPQKCLDCFKYRQCMGGCRIKMAFKYNDMTIATPDCGGPFLK